MRLLTVLSILLVFSLSCGSCENCEFQGLVDGQRYTGVAQDGGPVAEVAVEVQGDLIVVDWLMVDGTTKTVEYRIGKVAGDTPIIPERDTGDGS